MRRSQRRLSGWMKIAATLYIVRCRIEDMSLVSCISSPFSPLPSPSLSPLPLSSLFLFCFISFLPGCSKIQLHYTISLCHRFIAFLSQQYGRLSDCPKVTGCIFLQPQGRGGFINQNSLGVNFPEVFIEESKTWRVAVWPEAFLGVVIDSLT